MSTPVLDRARVPRSGRAVEVPLAVALRAATRYEENHNGCFISTYSVGSHGYAQVGWDFTCTGRGRGMTTAHRAAWTNVHGQIPLGMTVDHLCHQRRCVRLEHLRLATNVENATINHRSKREI